MPPELPMARFDFFMYRTAFGHGAFRFPALPWIAEYSDDPKQRVYQGGALQASNLPAKLNSGAACELLFNARR